MSTLRLALRATLATAAAVLASALMPRAAAAQADSVIVACYVPTSGSVYRIQTPDTPQACTKPAHVQFSWRRAGYSNAVVATAKGTLPAPSGKFLTATCPVGRTAISGGYRTWSDGLVTRPQQLSSYPQVTNGVPTGWGVGLFNSGPSTVNYEIYAVCVSGG
jgi:hypothetical protein